MRLLPDGSNGHPTNRTDDHAAEIQSDTAPATSPVSFRFAVNSQGRDKNWDFRTLSARFVDRTGAIEDVIHHVRQGHALCAGLLEGRWRKKANFAGSAWVLSEIDNSALLKDENGEIVKGADGKGIKVYQHQMTIEEALDHPLIQQHCTLIYTTPSHTPEWHRFRLVWRLPEFISDIDEYEAIVRLLLEQLPHDPACKDGVRVFYGNTGAQFPLINPTGYLPSEWRSVAQQRAVQEKCDRAERERIFALKREEFRRLSAEQGWDTDALVIEALNFIPPRQPGSGNYDECRQVLMALADYFGVYEAELIAEDWSPSIPGDTWNIRQKLKSFRRSGITIGTLFHLAQNYGFRFPKRTLILSE